MPLHFIYGPNFGRHFAEEFPLIDTDGIATRPREYVLAGYKDKQSTGCSFSWKTVEAHFRSDSTIDLHSDLKRLYRYNPQRFHSHIGGVIVIPYAPHRLGNGWSSTVTVPELRYLFRRTRFWSNFTRNAALFDMLLSMEGIAELWGQTCLHETPSSLRVAERIQVSAKTTSTGYR